jgi:hypothetical protein
MSEKITQVLILEDKDSFDIIIEDGGYAFMWFADGIWKCETYQGRITEKVTDDRTIDEICLDNSYKTFFTEGEYDSALRVDAIKWLILQAQNYQIERVQIDEFTKTNDIINKFLNL